MFSLLALHGTESSPSLANIMFQSPETEAECAVLSPEGEPSGQ